MLGVDFDVENPDAHPDLIAHLRQTAARYHRTLERIHVAP
jgi:hypothetical protein